MLLEKSVELDESIYFPTDSSLDYDLDFDWTILTDEFALIKTIQF